MELLEPPIAGLAVWPRDAATAIAIQQALAAQVRIADDFAPLRLIAGVDVSYDIASDISFAVIALMEYETLQLAATIVAQAPTTFPYIPGLLSFREIPVILQALEKLPEKPDLLMVDGQGIAHPRRLGIAAHLGVVTGLPAIGVAKSRLAGHYHEPGPRKGDRSPLVYKHETIGAVLRSRDNVAPLFISPGHRVGIESAVDITLRCLTRYRLPEPTRIADKISKRPDTKSGGNLL